MCFSGKSQPLEVGIIRNFKFKCRKLLLGLVVSRVNDSKTTSQMIEEVPILWAISWLQTAWMSVSPEINKNSFRKYVFDVEHNWSNKLSNWCRVSGIVWSTFFWNWHRRIHGFDIEFVTSLPPIDPLMVDWRRVMLLPRKPISQKRS